MLQIAICDDEVVELEHTRMLTAAYFARRPEVDAHIRHFQSSYDLMECIKDRGRFNLYLLDCIMPVMDGIGLGRFIRETDPNAVLVYLTSSKDFAASSYRVRALDYLLKPVTAAELEPVLAEAVRRMEREAARTLPVKTRDGVAAVPPSTLMYVEALNRVYFYHMADGRVVESISLRESFDTVLAPLLSDGRFYRAAASFLVNLLYTVKISAEGFLMQDGRTVPLSRGSYTQAQGVYVDFLLKHGRGDMKETVATERRRNT